MIFLFEAVPEQTVRRYFLQVPALLNSPVPGFTVRVANTACSVSGHTKFSIRIVVQQTTHTAVCIPRIDKVLNLVSVYSCSRIQLCTAVLVGNWAYYLLQL